MRKGGRIFLARIGVLILGALAGLVIRGGTPAQPMPKALAVLWFEVSGKVLAISSTLSTGLKVFTLWGPGIGWVTWIEGEQKPEYFRHDKSVTSKKPPVLSGGFTLCPHGGTVR
jgi:hypothetical protein